ncbi:MAG: HlyC/CorC family transporter [Rickettsiales bacterium]|nr:MAG: HlyC/CorC family transporter [Rickettsiales bacterium]
MPQKTDKKDRMLSAGSLTSGTLKIKNLFKKLFTKNRKSSLQFHKNENILHINGENSGEIVSNIKIFSEKTVEAAMVPRSDIIALNVDSSLEELSNTILEHGHTRTLIYSKNLDHIIGFIHIKDLFQVIVSSKKFNLKHLIRKHIIAPQSMKLMDLLTQMQQTRTHIAVIIDEYGGTDGIVTIEDIIEEIVGRIDDEHDDVTDEDSYKIIKPGIIITSARVEIEEIESAIGIRLKSEYDEIDTIGGLVMLITGYVPAKGDIITLAENITAEIIESTPRTIKQIKIIYGI